MFIVSFKVVTPDEYLGVLLGDLSSRRAAILNVCPREGMKLVTAHVPLACLIVSVLTVKMCTHVTLCHVGLCYCHKNHNFWNGITFCSLFSLHCTQQ